MTPESRGLVRSRDKLKPLYTARKTIFPKSWNIMESSKRPSKYHLSINFLPQKRPYFPSPKNSQQELFINL